MVNKTPIADLPSIDEFIVEPDLPSVSEFLEEEVKEEEEVIEEEVYNDAEGNPKIEVVDILQAPQWGELVRMVNDVREAIPEVLDPLALLNSRLLRLALRRLFIPTGGEKPPFEQRRL